MASQILRQLLRRQASSPALLTNPSRSFSSSVKEMDLKTVILSLCSFMFSAYGSPSKISCNRCLFTLRRYMHRYTTPSEYSVLQSKCLQHWYKNWQELRQDKLTASTFGAAIGLRSRRRVSLWLEKIGAVKPFTGNISTCWSNIKEEEALERYKLITGNTVLFPEFQVYDKKKPEDGWLAASPDGDLESLVYELPSNGMLEIKCPFFDGHANISLPWKRIPLYYMPQAQGLLEIMDRDWMDFYVWTPQGSSLFRVYRDSEYWELIKKALSDFWWNNVQKAKEECRKSAITNPLTELSDGVVPESKHESWPEIVRKSKHAVDNSRLLIREIRGQLQY